MSGQGEALTDAEMADYVREHRCYAARSDVTLADWDRGVAAIEAAAAREALAEVERLRLAIDAALAHLDHEHVGFARQTLARAARASDGGR